MYFLSSCFIAGSLVRRLFFKKKFFPGVRPRTRTSTRRRKEMKKNRNIWWKQSSRYFADSEDENAWLKSKLHFFGLYRYLLKSRSFGARFFFRHYAGQIARMSYNAGEKYVYACTREQFVRSVTFHFLRLYLSLSVSLSLLYFIFFSLFQIYRFNFAECRLKKVTFTDEFCIDERLDQIHRSGRNEN